MFKTAIIVSQNSKFCSQKQGTDRLFPLVNAMKESGYIVYNLLLYIIFYYILSFLFMDSFSFYAYMHLTMKNLCE